MSALQQMLAAAAIRNYATWNPSDKAASMTLSGGNLVTTSTNVVGFTRSTIGKSSGKWYWEIVPSVGTDTNKIIGVAKGTASVNDALGLASSGVDTEYGYWGAGSVYDDGVAVGTGSGGYTSGQTIGVALDMDSGVITFYVNNTQTWTVSGLSGTFYAAAGYYGFNVYTANFGASALTYTPPSGFNSGLFQ